MKLLYRQEAVPISVLGVLAEDESETGTGCTDRNIHLSLRTHTDLHLVRIALGSLASTAELGQRLMNNFSMQNGYQKVALFAWGVLKASFSSDGQGRHCSCGLQVPEWLVPIFVLPCQHAQLSKTWELQICFFWTGKQVRGGALGSVNSSVLVAGE